MKKYLIVLILAVLFLIGCMQEKKEKIPVKSVENEVLMKSVEEYSKTQLKRGFPMQNGEVYVLENFDIMTGIYLNNGSQIVHYDFQDFFNLSKEEEIVFAGKWSNAKPESSFLVNSDGKVVSVQKIRDSNMNFSVAVTGSAMTPESTSFASIIMRDSVVTGAKNGLKQYADGYGPKISFTPETVSTTSATVNVQLVSSVTDSVIKYTTDGTDPTFNSTVYMSIKRGYTGLTLSTTKTVKVKAEKSDWVPGSVYSKTYSLLKTSEPVISLGAGTYGTIKTVTITDVTSGATIRYTTDGTVPSKINGIIYDKGKEIIINKNTTLQAIAYCEGYRDSEIAEAFYEITDTTPPLPGNSGNITVSNIDGEKALITWSVASDNISTETQLFYKAVISTTPGTLGTITDAETNGIVLTDWTNNINNIKCTSLKQSTTYYVNILVKDGAGNKGLYAMTSFATPDYISPVPGNTGTIQLNSITTYGAVLNWTKGEDNKDSQSQLLYKIVKSETNNISSVEGAETNGVVIQDWTQNINAVNITGFNDTTRYFINVLVKDISGNKSAYNPANTFTTDATKPAAGNGGILALTNVTVDKITIGWTKAADNYSIQGELQYKVVKSISNDINTLINAEMNGTIVQDWANNIESVRAEGLADNTTYYFNVIVRDEAGNRAVYVTGNSKTLDGTPPTTGSAITFSDITINSMLISWGAATDNKTAVGNLQYKVVYSTSNNIDNIVNAENNGTIAMNWTANTISKNISGLALGTPYYSAVIVKDEAGNKSLYEVRTQATLSQDGSEDYPFLIDSIEKLAKVGTGVDGWNLDKYYKLTKNLDFTSSASYESGIVNSAYTSGTGWSSIGNDSIVFTGNFDGQNYTISNLYIDNSAMGYEGLFGFVIGGTIKNLGLIDASITAGYNVGGLVGVIYNGSIINCYAENITLNIPETLDGMGMTRLESVGGGLIGCTLGTDISSCYATGSVTGAGSSVGGFVGSVGDGVVINNCYADVYVRGKNKAGGFVGYAQIAVIKNSYAVGNVEGTSSVGGFAGDNNQNQLINCYASGDVSGQYTNGVQNIGGLVGANGGTVTNSIAFNGSVAGANTAGTAGTVNTIKQTVNRFIGVANYFGIVGTSAGSYAIDTMTVTISTMGNTYAPVGVKSTSEIGGADLAKMTNISSAPMSSWDFNSDGDSDKGYWKLESGKSRPVLFVDPDGNGIFTKLGTDTPNDDEVTAPTQGTAIQFSGITTTSMAISWGAASDNVTPSAGLKYKLVYSTTNNITTVANAEANGTLAMDWTANTITKAVSGLTVGTAYYFAVIAVDNAGNKSLYEVKTQTTLLLQDGSAANPFLVDSIDKLAKVGSGTEGWNLDKYYKMTKNLDFTNAENYESGSVNSAYTSGTGWSGISNGSNYFSGNFDGQNYMIFNLYINNIAKSYIGLFGNVYGGTIKNLGIVNARVTAGYNVGGLVGIIGDGSIINCYAENVTVNIPETLDEYGYPVTESSGGGLIGHAYRPNISSCYVTGSVTGAGSRVGGFVGSFGDTGTRINNCYADVYVRGKNQAGGFVGYAQNAVIKNSYAVGNVEGTLEVGGFAGANNQTQLINCYASGDVSGQDTDFVQNIGGLVGVNGGTGGTVTNSIAFNGSVTGANTAGTAWTVDTIKQTVNRLVGSYNYYGNIGTSAGSYARDTMAVTISTMGNTYVSVGVKSTSQFGGADLAKMTNISSAPMSSWDFNSDGDSDKGYWKLESGKSRPVLFVDPDEDGTFTKLGTDTPNDDEVTAPTPGTAITFADIGGNSVNVNWGAASDNVTPSAELKYKLIYSAANNITTVVNAEANGTVAMDWAKNIVTKSVSGLSEATTYYFTVIVIDNAGNQSIYSVNTMTTTDITSPVTGTGITFADIGATSVNVNWGAATDNITPLAELKYKLVYSTTNNINSVANAEANGTTSMDWTANTITKSVSGLSEATTYYFAIIVKDAAGNKTVYSTNTMGTSDITSPTIGTAITFSDIAATSVNISWGVATDNKTIAAELKYTLIYSTSNNITTIANAEANGVSAMDWTANTVAKSMSGLTSGVTYYFAVMVKDNAGNKSIYEAKSCATTISQDGSAAGPFIVDSIEKLAKVGSGTDGWNLDKYYKLSKNLDFTSSASYESGIVNTTYATGTGWIGIGSTPDGVDYANAFKGNFDGQNFTIANMRVNDSTKSFVGLFGGIYHAVIKNIGITGITIEADSNIGALCSGDIEGSTIENCYSTGTINNSGSILGRSGMNIGGLAGFTVKTVMTNCYSSVSIKGNGDLGGLIGMDCGGSVIKACYATGNIAGYRGNSGAPQNAGGFIGEVTDWGYGFGNSLINGCYATGTLTGSDDNGYSFGNKGGFIGNVSIVDITNCYATGAVNTNGGLAGGFAGNMYSGTITNCYSIGAVNSINTDNICYVGGLIGSLASGTLSNSVAFGTSIVAKYYYNDALIKSSSNRVVGNKVGTMTNCYANSTMSVMVEDAADAIVKGAALADGADIASMADNSVVPLSLWEFNTDANSDKIYWKIESGKPRPVLFVDPDGDGTFTKLGFDSP